jgi:hypothetical protein
MAYTNDEFPEDSMFRANTSANDSTFGSSPFAAHQQFNQTNPFDDRVLMPPPPPQKSPALCNTNSQFESTGGFDFGSSSARNEENPFGFDENHLKACTAAAVDDMTESDFKSGGDYLEEFAREELENRKIFADNDLTINVDQNKGAAKNSQHSGSSSASSGKTSSSGDWWSNASHLNQASHLELSNVSTWHNNSISTAPPAVSTQEADSNKQMSITNIINSATKNNLVTVSDYFNKVCIFD